MTLISIVQRVADEVGYPRPLAVSASSDQFARQMFALANATLEDLGKDDWHALQDSYDFDTVVAVSDYTLPSDYARLISNSALNTDLHYSISGSLTPEMYGRVSNRLTLAIGRFVFRVLSGVIKLTPEPDAAESLSFPYVSNNLAVSSGSVAKRLFELDDDSPRVPEELVIMGLKWRMKHAKGLEYGEDYNAYMERRKTLMAQELSLGAIPVAVRYGYDSPELGEFYVPDNGFG